MISWVLVIVFPLTSQMGYKFHKTEEECYKSAVKAAAVAQKKKVPFGWKCFKENDPAYSEVMKQVREHQNKGSI